MSYVELLSFIESMPSSSRFFLYVSIIVYNSQRVQLAMNLGKLICKIVGRDMNMNLQVLPLGSSLAAASDIQGCVVTRLDVNTEPLRCEKNAHICHCYNHEHTQK